MKMEKLLSYNRKNNSSGVLTPHAISDDSRVFGTKTKITSPGDSGDLVRWETDMNADVSKLVTTENGDVIAILTSDQSLSILRGSDGTILVSRDIGPKRYEEDGE